MDKPLIFVVFFSIAFLYSIYLYDDNNKKINNNGIVLVTGSSSGIGQTTSLYLAEKGFTVFAAVRKQKDVEQLKTLVKNRNLLDKVIPVIMDVTNPSQIESTRNKIEEYSKSQNIDFISVVNNAGIMFASPVEFTNSESLRQIFEVNYFGPYTIIQQFLPLLKRAKKGNARIINISSVSGRISPPLLSAYSGTKYALESLCDSLRTELKEFDIHTTCLEPGYVKTPFTANSKSNNMASRNSEHEKTYPLLKKFHEVQNKGKGVESVVVSESIHNVLTVKSPPARLIVGDEATPMFFISKLPQTIIDWILLNFSYE